MREEFSSFYSSPSQYLSTTSSAHSVLEAVASLSLDVARLVLHSIACVGPPKQSQWVPEDSTTTRG